MQEQEFTLVVRRDDRPHDSALAKYTFTCSIEMGEMLADAGGDLYTDSIPIERIQAAMRPAMEQALANFGNRKYEVLIEVWTHGHTFVWEDVLTPPVGAGYEGATDVPHA